MATAGEGPSATPSLGYAGNGGVGGKFRKRPFRKTNTTPYDRPPTAFRNPSWLSKHLMEPASKLVTSGYQLFFSSLFRKRLPAPPPPSPPQPELNKDTSREQPERVQEVSRAEAHETAVGDGAHLAQSPPDGVISDLEQLLRKKTFTRSEIDRLTELLHSRAVDFPHQSDVRRTELSNGKLAANSELQQQCVASPSEGIRIQSDVSHGMISTPAISTQILEEDIASPAELAKAYMGHQASKVSPSMLSSRVRAVREDPTLLSNVPFTPKSAMLSLATKTGLENGYTTPRSRGRSAIYNMARTPYSRVHQTAFEKGSGSRLNGYGGPLLLAPSGKDLPGEISNRMGLKRRSSALDDDYGSVGPMRRTRQKPSILSHRGSLSQGFGGVSSASKHPFTNEKVYKGPKFTGENDDNRTPRPSCAHVPPKSTETASKILEHLERMTPKAKSAELKLIAAKEKSPAKLTTDMLRGQALKSLEDADSSKLMYSDQAVNRLENVSRGKEVCVSRGKEVSTSGSTQENDTMEGKNLQKLGSPSNVAVHAENSDATTSGKITFKSVETSDSAAKFDAQRPQKKQAFMMSAHEDLLDWDDDTNLNGPASEVLPKGNANTEIIENKHSSSAETSVPESASLVVSTVPSSLGSDNPKPASDKVQGSESPSTVPVGEPADPKPLVLMQAKPDITNRTDGIFTTGTTGFYKSSGSERGIDNTLHDAAVTNGTLGSSLTEGLSSSSTTESVSTISPGVSTSNGPPAVSPSIIASAPSPTHIELGNPFLTNGTGNASSVGTSSSFASPTLSPAATSSALSLSAEPVTFQKKPVFNFVSFGNPSTTHNPELTAGKTGKEENTDNSSNFPSTSTPVVTIGTGSNSFGFSTSSQPISQSQDSLSSSGNGSLPNAQSLVAGSEASVVTTSAPVKLSDPASSVFPIFNAPSFTSSNTSFNSMTTKTAVNPFSSGTTSLVNNSSGSFSETKSLGPSTSATPGVFMAKTSSLSPATDASSSSTPATGIFNFGAKTSSLSPSTESNPASTPAAGNPFVGTWPAAKPSPIFNGSSFAPSPSTSFQFGNSSNFSGTAASTAPIMFGGPTSAPALFNAASAPTPSPSPFAAQPVFNSGAQAFAAPATNNDQMSTEDSMAEDPVHSSVPAGPVFGQPPVSPTPSPFTFASPPPTLGNTFQFGGQQNQPASQNQSLFQGSGSQEFGGGSFSLGSGHGGGDKSNRRYVKVNKNSRTRRK
ncbi:OLC1v1026455C1 [Oldenlandia corymbosa var. corymbosa]|uniref:OLC1v1026455C1 n=1 Tax=Oldenlandia corymbosa var. corymbosa TaxID=529605 RepID=A0AAV1C9C1_OLDCO|nr:OLC1v1026455C1 [Oldenlandia corymbosa var. corymbosa]